jgi:hypothetical protein
VGLGRVTAVKVKGGEAAAAAREIFEAVRDPAVRALPAVQKIFIERAGLVMRSKPRSPHYTAFGREMKRLEALHLEAIARPPPLALHSPRAALPTVQNKRSISASSQTDDRSNLPAAAAVARPAKRQRRSVRLRPAAEIIAELTEQVERMKTARDRLYQQKSRAVQKVGKKEDEIDEMEKEGEKFMALATELRSEVRRYAEIARVKDLKADELEEQIKALEKDLPAPVRSDIEDSLLHIETFDGGRYTAQVRLLYYILCITGSVSANAATRTLELMLTVLGYSFGKLPSRSTVQTFRFEPLILNDADTVDLIGNAEDGSLCLSTDAGAAKGVERNCRASSVIVIVMNLRSCAPGQLWPTTAEYTANGVSYTTRELGHVY